MRLLLSWGFVCALVGRAVADMYYEAPPPPKPPDDEFWREVVAPHGDEIQMILEKARTAWNYTANCNYSDCDATGEWKAKLLDEAYGMLRYARRLDPNQQDVLMLLGQVAEESGRPAAAIDALTAYIGLLDPDTSIPVDVAMRLGKAYLRLGRTEDAIRYFRSGIAQGVSGYGESAAALSYLSTALMNSGRMADAIDLLAPNMTMLLNSYYSPQPMQAMLTLAVAYDRDEQINAAFTVIDSLQNALSTSFPQYAQQAMQAMLWVPAYDEHYFLGLFYESLGYLSEARTEWLHYAEAKDAPFRGRALDHADAIDDLLDEKLKAAQKAAKDAEAAKKKAEKEAKKKNKPRKKPKTR